MTKVHKEVMTKWWVSIRQILHWSLHHYDSHNDSDILQTRRHWCLSAKSALTEQMVLVHQLWCHRLSRQKNVIKNHRQYNERTDQEIPEHAWALQQFFLIIKMAINQKMSTLMSDEMKIYINLFFFIRASFSFSLFLSFFTMLLLWSCCLDNFSPASEEVHHQLITPTTYKRG